MAGRKVLENWIPKRQTCRSPGAGFWPIMRPDVGFGAGVAFFIEKAKPGDSDRRKARFLYTKHHTGRMLRNGRRHTVLVSPQIFASHMCNLHRTTAI